jgi:hypothetical protein
MKVKLLTAEQKDLLLGVEIANSHFYNPSVDANGDWFISTEECDQTTNSNYAWVKDLPEIDYTPIPFDLAAFNVN